MSSLYLCLCHQIARIQDDGSPLQPITFPMHVMKPLGGYWLKEFYQYMQMNGEIICSGFRAAGITDVLRL